MQKPNLLCLAALLGMGVLAPLPKSLAQTPAEVKQALEEARNGSRIQDRYGDKALRHFAAARFDKDPLIRKGAIEAAGTSLESLLFVLPMIEDDDVLVATPAMSRMLYCDREAFTQLKAPQIVPRIAAALKKHPTISRSPQRLMDRLTVYKRDPTARRLLTRLFSEHNWRDLLGYDRPTQWDRTTVGVLLVQCEIGLINSAQMQPIFDANPGARLTLL
ncbi:MAG: hypothetical protein V4671_10420, partial [Armatimonadota bacterium]